MGPNLVLLVLAYEEGMQTQVQRDNHVKTQGEASQQGAKERGLRGNQSCRHLAHRPPPSKTLGKFISVV